MGYVRMIRSGGLHFVSNAVKFVPSDNNKDYDTKNKFKTLVIEDGKLSEETLKAAEVLDNVVENMRLSFDEGVEYFQVS